MTFRDFADIYKQQHAVAKNLSLARTMDWRIRPILERFGDWALTDIKTADVEDFVADLRKPRIVGKQAEERCLTPASINRTVELLRHMLNWAVGREYLEKTPFRRGTETLIKKLREDNQRRRRLSTDEELRLLAAAPPHLRSMIITALDTGMRRGEMLALQFADVDMARGLIVLRGETTKSKKTRLVPISTQRLHDAWLRTVLRAHGIKPRWAARLKHKGLFKRVEGRVPQDQPAMARPATRVRLARGRARCAARAGPRPARSRVHHHDRALRQPEAGEPADRRCEARERTHVRAAGTVVHPRRGARRARVNRLPAEAGSHRSRGANSPITNRTA